MAQRVTIQDIAKELGLSRNTVSKAINNTGSLSPDTRDSILKKAQEMGYKLFSYSLSPTQNESEENAQEEKGDFVLFTTMILDSMHFSAKMLEVIQEEAAKLGYGFTMYRIMAQDLKELRLPRNFDKSRAKGIFCVEMFDLSYCKFLCNLGLPILFADTPITFGEKPLLADTVLMENRNGIYEFINEMTKKGKKKFAFIGEALHCRSFFERYDAFRGGLEMFLGDDAYEMSKQWNITKNSSSMSWNENMTEKIKGWKEKPEVIICANDFIATDVLLTLRSLDIKVPEDVLLCGFDDSPQAQILSPKLTSIRINARDMGYAALNLMLLRLENPQKAYRTSYVESTLVYRESSNG